MASKHQIGDLRAAIEGIVRDVMEKSGNGEAANDVVLARLKSERKSLVTFFTPQLVDMALTKLLNEGCQKRARIDAHSEQGDLFGGFGKIPLRVTIERGLKKDTANLSISEAKRWLESHSNRVVENDNGDFAKLVAECERVAESNDETIAEALNRLRQVQQAAAEELIPD